eukprot:787938-Rhodomonas_salina.1
MTPACRCTASSCTLSRTYSLSRPPSACTTSSGHHRRGRRALGRESTRCVLCSGRDLEARREGGARDMQVTEHHLPTATNTTKSARELQRSGPKAAQTRG